MINNHSKHIIVIVSFVVLTFMVASFFVIKNINKSQIEIAASATDNVVTPEDMVAKITPTIIPLQTSKNIVFESVSPNKNKKIYLEKEYSLSTNKNFRHILYLEDLVQKTKKTLIQDNNVLCNIDYNPYSNLVWLNDEYFSVIFNKTTDCTNREIHNFLYDKEGSPIIDDFIEEHIDFNKESDSPGFKISSFCNKTETEIDFIFQKINSKKYSSIKFNLVTGAFYDQEFYSDTVKNMFFDQNCTLLKN